METTVVNKYKNIYYPPGGILLWLIIFLELITFGLALVSMVYYGNQEAAIFHESKMKLNLALGTLNTLVLITSGYFMARAVLYFKKEDRQKTAFNLKITMVFGVLFLVFKGFEYYFKIDAGLTMGVNTFFTYYWLLTLFHVIHVIVGLIILALSHYNLKKTSLEDFEAGATFWHMCDLIWLLLFPVVYLMF